MATLTDRRRTMSRVREIAQIATKHGFGFVFERHTFRRSTAIETQNLPALGRHLREMLDELGPTFVKFGQLLSTRPDIVPPEILAELRLLQDSVSPVPYADVERVVETELKSPIDRLFVAFDPVPVAAASIGQVHLAELAERAPGRGQGAAAQRRPSGRVRPQLAVSGRAHREAPGRPAVVHRSGGGGGRVRALDPARTRLPHRGPKRRDLPAQFRRGAQDRDPAACTPPTPASGC